MKKVTVFIGSPQKRATYQAVQEFEKNLKSYGEIDFEYVFLKDYRLCHLRHIRGSLYCKVPGDYGGELWISPGKRMQSDDIRAKN